MTVALALIHHDPRGLLFDQTVRVLPQLQQTFDDVAVYANVATDPRSLAYLTDHRVRVKADAVEGGFSRIGKFRRAAVEFALQGPGSFIIYCDFDRILHWMEYHPEELQRVTQQITPFDFTILGRTPRAFATHPRIHRDTEAIINHVFERVADRTWDAVPNPPQEIGGMLGHRRGRTRLVTSRRRNNRQW